jgi:hypothetical protein
MRKARHLLGLSLLVVGLFSLRATAISLPDTSAVRGEKISDTSKVEILVYPDIQTRSVIAAISIGLLAVLLFLLNSMRRKVDRVLAGTEREGDGSNT